LPASNVNIKAWTLVIDQVAKKLSAG